MNVERAVRRQVDHLTRQDVPVGDDHRNVRFDGAECLKKCRIAARALRLQHRDVLFQRHALHGRRRERGAAIPLPTDVVCAKQLSAESPAEIKPVTAVQDDELIVDIGPASADAFAQLLHDAGTIVWNGPVGVFEIEAFAHGTERLARAIADSNAFSLAGGGDTLAAIAKYGISERISYISTGGGAFLEFLEGRTLPAVAILEERAKQQ